VNKAILKLDEYLVSKSDLDGLSDDQQAAFAVLCFAVSELNSLARMYLFSSQKLNEQGEIIAALAIQSNLLIRTISSKLFEIREFLEFKGKYNKTSDSKLLEFGKNATQRFAAIGEGVGYDFAVKLRHEASFHYHLKPARKRLKWVSSDALRSLYLHKLKGNSFYPFGEEALFIGLINESISSLDEVPKAQELIEAWANWSTSASGLVNELFDEFVTNFILSLNPDRKSFEKVYWVDPELIGTLVSTKTPAFIKIARSET